MIVKLLFVFTVFLAPNSGGFDHFAVGAQYIDEMAGNIWDPFGAPGVDGDAGGFVNTWGGAGDATTSVPPSDAGSIWDPLG
jgi:hypothetical protein